MIETRKEEVLIGNDIIFLKITGIFLFYLTPVLSIVFALGAYQYFNDVLNINTIIITLFLFDLIQRPIRAFPSVYSDIMETLVSLRRIEVIYLYKLIKNNIFFRDF